MIFLLSIISTNTPEKSPKITVGEQVEKSRPETAIFESVNLKTQIIKAKFKALKDN